MSDASISDVELLTSNQGLRPWLSAQLRFGRADHVGAAARLVGSKKESIFDRVGMKNPQAGVNHIYKGLVRIMENEDIELSPQDKFDLAAAINHWDEIVQEWRDDHDSVDAMSEEKGLSGSIGTSMARAPGYTAELPVPFSICIMPNCRKTAVLGGDRCEKHGGHWLDPATRQAMLMTAFEKLVTGADTAVDTLLDVMENSRRDDARVAAARELLDRVGIRPGTDIHLHVHGDGEEQESAVSIIRQRLADMHQAIEDGKKIDPALLDGSAIVDAEIVEDEETELPHGEEPG